MMAIASTATDLTMLEEIKFVGMLISKPALNTDTCLVVKKFTTEYTTQ